MAEVLASREAVQPSLWDRLIDDLPGLNAEIESRRADLEKNFGADRIATLFAGGSKEIERDQDLSTSEKRQLHRLLQQHLHRNRLDDHGIVVTPTVLREAVRRDIEVLFNTERFEANYMLTPKERSMSVSADLDLTDFPQVRRSVLNYGVPSFSGHASGDFDRVELGREIKRVLAVFEPRLKLDSVKVKVKVDPKTGMEIEIDALLIMSPVSERLKFRTMIDLDNGQAVTSVDDR